LRVLECCVCCVWVCWHRVYAVFDGFSVGIGSEGSAYTVIYCLEGI
jgi:hypothetical protein